MMMMMIKERKVQNGRKNRNYKEKRQTEKNDE
jgi:hypothetical protein